MTSAYVQKFLEGLNGVRQVGDGWAARCPCRNDDDNPSVSVTEGEDGRVLAICHRGSPCSFGEICEAVGIKIQETMPHREDFIKAKPKLSLVKTYDYHDSEGVLLFQKLRYIDEDGKKTFRQRKPDGKGGWDWSLGSTPKVLYNLPAVMAAKSRGTRIFVVEGEKDADALIEKGAVATTMPGGAGKWLPIHTEALAGAEVDVIADNDEVGLEHARRVIEELRRAGCSVRGWRSSVGKDVYDLLSEGGTFRDLLELEEDGDVEEVVEPEVKAEVLPVEEADEPDEVREVLSGITKLFERTDISMLSKVNRASLLINSLTLDAPADVGRLVPWGDFIEESDDDSYDWVIPGVIERQERVIVVAAEGVGKTMLARQVAICSAAGIQPFTRQRMPPIRTLTIDLENPERIIRRTSRVIVQNARSLGYSKSLEAHLLIKPAGLDLLKATDRKIVEEAIERVKPDLLLLGPLYKSFIDPGGRTPEAIAVEIAKYLDMIRDVYNCALWLEHHAPLGNSMSSRDLRPFGSAVWSRWPEFGLALQPDPTNPDGYVYEVNHFRGARDKRHFPTKMKRGTYFPFESIEFAKVD